jgi:hypothetical protein
VGRWLGHGIATIFAIISLINILQTFKRVLLAHCRRQINENPELDAVRCNHRGKAALTASDDASRGWALGATDQHEIGPYNSSGAVHRVATGQEAESGLSGGTHKYATTKIMQTIQTLEVSP